MRPPASRKIRLESSIDRPFGPSRGPLAGFALALAFLAAPLAVSQGTDAGGSSQEISPSAPGQHRGGQYAGMGRAGGEVTAVTGNTLTVKGENGRPVTIVTTDNTRVMKASGPVRVSDLHLGDGLMAFGNLDPATGTLHAAMVMATDAAELKAMRENLGKTYITGRVTAINLDDAKMTVERPDHVAQTIGFDESTSFKRAVRGERGANGGNPNGNPGGEGRGTGGMGMGGGMGTMAGGGAALDRAFANGESITLADIKVGDNVMGTGAMKGSLFVPNRLIENPPRAPRARGSEAPGAGTPSGATAAPGAPGPGTR